MMLHHAPAVEPSKSGEHIRLTAVVTYALGWWLPSLYVSL